VVRRFGIFELDTVALELRQSGSRVRLPDQSLRVLRLLTSRPGDLVTREELQRELWADGTFVDFDHGLNEAINKLRGALGDAADEPRFIETLPRRGYRFVAPVESLAPPPPGIEATAEASPPRRRRSLALPAGLAAILIPALAILLSRRMVSFPPEGEVRSIAVLPLANLSRDPEQDYFSDGMTDALIARLAEIEGLRVISRTSIMRYKGSPDPLPKIARELGVDAIVEGSVLREGDRVRITGQLIRARSDEHLWAGSFEREMGSVLDLQREVAEALARGIELELAQRAPGPRRIDPQVYQAYLRGRYHWNQRTPEGFHKALGHLEEAVARDPAYAEAWSALADCYNLMAAYNVLPHPQAAAKARAAAKRALALREDLGEAHAALGWVEFWYGWDMAAADREFRRALELSPGYAFAHLWQAVFLTAEGRFEEARAAGERALALDPLSVAVRENQGWLRYSAGEYDEAIGRLGRALELDPGYPHAHRYLGLCHLMKGDHARAIDELSRTRAALPDDPQTIAELAIAHARAGDTPRARALLQELEGARERGYVSPWLFALVTANLGEKEEALTWLERGYDEHASHLVFLKVDPLLRDLRGAPRREDLLRRLGLDGPRGPAPKQTSRRRPGPDAGALG
jgi:TolB-like protein/Tfp pilus assembly protein PilF/DNA-binding winged helix-turn-helix (wHTH) protein